MQNSKLYVGNLSYSVTDTQLKEKFSEYGEVKEVTLIPNKGFGFVQMSNPEEAEKAKDAFNGTQWEGRTMKVDEARPPSPKKKAGGFRQNRSRGSFGNRDRGSFGSRGRDRGSFGGRDRGRGGQSRGFRG